MQSGVKTSVVSSVSFILGFSGTDPGFLVVVVIHQHLLFWCDFSPRFSSVDG